MDEQLPFPELPSTVTGRGGEVITGLDEIAGWRRKPTPDVFVSVYRGRFNNQDVVAKVFLTPTASGFVANSRATREIDALRHLGAANCASAPYFIADFFRSTPYGIEHYVVMNYIPASPVAQFVDDNKFEERKDQIKQGFDVAIHDVWRNGVDNGSPHLGNLLFDKTNGDCYIIDFEEAKMGARLPLQPSQWSHWKDHMPGATSGGSVSTAAATAGSESTAGDGGQPGTRAPIWTSAQANAELDAAMAAPTFDALRRYLS